MYDEKRKKYEKETFWGVSLKFNKNTEGEMIEKLQSLKNRQGYIKNLIRKDIKANAKKG